MLKKSLFWLAILSVPCGTYCIAEEPISGASSEGAVIIIKAGQWMSKSSMTTDKPSYVLDIFATCKKLWPMLFQLTRLCPKK